MIVNAVTLLMIKCSASAYSKLTADFPPPPMPKTYCSYAPLSQNYTKTPSFFYRKPSPKRDCDLYSNKYPSCMNDVTLYKSYPRVQAAGMEAPYIYSNKIDLEPNN